MESLKNKTGVVYSALFIFLVATSFISQEVYAFTVRFDSLIIFLALAVLALPYIRDDLAKRDPDLIMTLLVILLSAVFAVLVHSGYGAVLIPSDLALISYMTKHIRLNKRNRFIISFAGSAPVALWYSHVRWSYNFNMAGFAFMLMAYFGMLLMEIGAENETVNVKLKGFLETVIFITGFILSMLYHSRTAMFGMLMFGVVYILFEVMLTDKPGLRIVLFFASAGAVIFTVVYIRLAAAFGGVTVLYKDVFSGREGIWSELWEAFLRQPVTGIGSAYELKSFEIFEVHNGLYDILTVHGIIVFILVVVLLWRMLERACQSGLHNNNHIGRIAFSAALSMMFTSYFENFFTVPPYSFIFMTFVLFLHSGGTECLDREKF